MPETSRNVKETPPIRESHWEEIKDLPGLVLPEGGVKPITDWQAFVDSLPDFGEDAVRLTEALLEDRRRKRMLAGHEE